MIADGPWTIEVCPVCGRNNTANRVRCYGSPNASHEKAAWAWVEVVPAARLAEVEDRWDQMLEEVRISGHELHGASLVAWIERRWPRERAEQAERRLAEVEAERDRLCEKNERVVRQMDAELKRKPSVTSTIVAYWVAQLREAKP